MNNRHSLFFILLLAVVPATFWGQEPVCNQMVSGSGTIVRIPDLQTSAAVSPMIYGQMLEDCNDNVVYGGIVNKLGEENYMVTELLKKLQIPVVRWPAGTAIYDYDWRRGVGPLRTAQSEKIWGGKEFYTFGTDEYINWCRKIGAEPYINIPMGNNNTFNHSLDEAFDWVEYVNGEAGSPMGAYRARNGHRDPFGVKYWCLGNENYLANQFHESENASVYAEKLYAYASALKRHFPEISLLGVGHTGDWNETVLDKCGRDIDFLTLHFYLNAKINDRELEAPAATLFAPEKVEASIQRFSHALNAYNKSAGRQPHPVRFSIDEWNCRHSVYNGSGYSFTRKDARRLYDAAAMACMLNVFIRTSPFVGMANYIFPVNGHGLLKTVGEQDAYTSACYPVFDLYRHFMTGRAVGVEVTGPGLKDVSLNSLDVAGDVDSSLENVRRDFCFIDCAAVADEAHRLVVSLVNRSYDTSQEVGISAPPGYEAVEAWTIDHTDVRAENTAEERENVTARQIAIRNDKLTLSPGAVAVVVMQPLPLTRKPRHREK